MSIRSPRYIIARRLIAVASVTIISGGGIHIASAADQVVSFNIANITDFHGYIIPGGSHPGAEKLHCAVIDAADGLPQHLVSSGDSMGGSPFDSAILNDEPTIEVLNEMGLVATAVGNHEFDKGYGDLTGRVRDLSNFPLLGANVEGHPALESFHIEEIDGTRVAYVGTATIETPSMVADASVQDLIFHEPVNTTNQIADQLVAEDHADIVVALFHEGINGSEQWSNNVDLVFAGHTHMVKQPETADNGHTLVMQSGNYGHALSDVNLTFNHTTGELIVDQAQVITLDAIQACDTPYPATRAIISAAEDAASVEGDVAVSTIAQTFHLGKNPNGEAGSNHGVESQLNNMVAEGVYQDLQARTQVNPDMAIMNAGGLRVELEAGEVTYRDLFNIQPFAGENSTTTLTGTQLKDVLEQQWREGSTRPIENLGVSNNVSYTFDNALPQGERITSITINGEYVQPEQNYVIAGSKFILGGGSGFTAFAAGTPLSNLGITDVDSTINYLAGTPDPQPRAGQSGISISASGEFTAGQDITLNLESLAFTQGDTASEVTIMLGDTVVTAPITALSGSADLNDAGQASVTFTVPAGLAGTQELRITTNAGTDITMPVELKTASTPKRSSLSGSSF